MCTVGSSLNLRITLRKSLAAKIIWSLPYWGWCASPSSTIIHWSLRFGVQMRREAWWIKLQYWKTINRFCWFEISGASSEWVKAPHNSIHRTVFFTFFVTAFLNTGLIMIANHTAQCTYIDHINSLNMININLPGRWLLPEGWNFQNVLGISSYMDSLTELEGFANAHWEQARSLLTAGSFRLETQITQSTWFEDHHFLLLTSLTALH